MAEKRSYSRLPQGTLDTVSTVSHFIGTVSILSWAAACRQLAWLWFLNSLLMFQIPVLKLLLYTGLLRKLVVSQPSRLSSLCWFAIFVFCFSSKVNPTGFSCTQGAGTPLDCNNFRLGLQCLIFCILFYFYNGVEKIIGQLLILAGNWGSEMFLPFSRSHVTIIVWKRLPLIINAVTWTKN